MLMVKRISTYSYKQHSSVEIKYRSLVPFRIGLFEYAGHCLQFVPLPLPELIFNPIHNVLLIWLIRLKSLLNAVVDLFLDFLREETHLTPVHQQQLHLCRIRYHRQRRMLLHLQGLIMLGRSYCARLQNGHEVQRRELARLALVVRRRLRVIVVEIVLEEPGVIVVQEQYTPAEVVFHCQGKECHL